MAVLFRYELKKLFSGKLLWAALAVCLAYTLLYAWFNIENGLNGRVRGLRDVYAQYEGRVVTEAFKQEVRRDYERYVASHPDQFDTLSASEDGSVHYYAKHVGYYSGVSAAFGAIDNALSSETLRGAMEESREALRRGTNEDGSPFSIIQLDNYKELAGRRFVAPEVHYAEGWNQLYSTGSPFPGSFVLFLTALWLLPLFYRESTARMEGIVLSSAKRGRAAAAKLLAAACVTGVAFVLFFGPLFLSVALTYGLDGASLPLSALDWGVTGDMTVGTAFSLAAIALLLAALASSGLTALSSALFRRPVAALLCSAALIALPFLLRAVYDSGYEFGFEPLQSPIGYYLFDYLRRLPSLALFEYNSMVYGIAKAPILAYSIAFPALLTGLICWLAPRQFLKQRKA